MTKKIKKKGTYYHKEKVNEGWKSHKETADERWKPAQPQPKYYEWGEKIPDSYYKNVMEEPVKEENVIKNSASHFSPSEQNFGKKTQKLCFCNECGALMFPDKVNYKLVMKCKCGFTKLFDENKTNSYKISSLIKHICTEESIFRCVCTKRFQSHVEFLEHVRNCKKIVVRDNIQLLENKGAFFHVNNIDPLKKKGTFLESFRSAIFKFPESSINTQGKMAKKMGIYSVKLSKEMNLVIDQSYSGHVISKLSNLQGYKPPGNRPYIKEIKPSNLLLVIISIIGPILQHSYALGYDREKILDKLKFFKYKQRVEDWTQYIFKMTSAQALIYFNGFSNYYDLRWWHQNFGTSKDFLAI